MPYWMSARLWCGCRHEAAVLKRMNSILPFAAHSPRCFWSPDHHSSVWSLLVYCSETRQKSRNNGQRQKHREMFDCCYRLSECTGQVNMWHKEDKHTFFSKMRAVVSAIAWRSSNTQRTQRNCRGGKTAHLFSTSWTHPKHSVSVLIHTNIKTVYFCEATQYSSENFRLLSAQQLRPLRQIHWIQKEENKVLQLYC